MTRFSVGDHFPDCRICMFSGVETDVSEVVLKKKHTVFWLMRFIGCRNCQYDMDTLAKEYPAFADMDAQVLVALQSTPASIAEVREGYQPPFDIICDAEYRLFDMLQVPVAVSKEARQPQTEGGKAFWAEKQKRIQACGYKHKTDEGRSEQLPAVFIVGDDQRIEYVHYAAYNIDYPGVAEVLRILEALPR